jgi:hypothetical protein
MVLVVTHLAASEQFRQTIDHGVSMREGGEEKNERPIKRPRLRQSWSQHPCVASDGDYSMTHIRSCTTRTRHTYEACPLDSLKLTSKVSHGFQNPVFRIINAEGHILVASLRSLYSSSPRCLTNRYRDRTAHENEIPLSFYSLLYAFARGTCHHACVTVGVSTTTRRESIVE